MSERVRHVAKPATLLALVLSLLLPMPWNRCFPKLSGDVEQVVLTEVRPEDDLQLAPGAQRARRIGIGSLAAHKLAFAAEVSRAGRYSIYGISSASESWPLRMEVNGHAVSATAFFQSTGSMRSNFEEHRIATGVELQRGRNLFTLRGEEIESRTLVLSLRREGPLRAKRYVGLAAISLIALVTRQIGLSRCRFSARGRLVATTGLAATLLAGSAVGLWRWAGQDLIQLGYSVEGRALRLRRLEALESHLASPEHRDRQEKVDVLVLGDSTHVFPHPPGGEMIPTLRSLVPEARRREVGFFGIGAGGLDVQDYYLLLNRLASEQPDLVIIPVNLRFFGSRPFAAPRFGPFEGYLLASELLSLRVLDIEASHVLLRWADGLVFRNRVAPFLRGAQVWFEREEARVLADFSAWVQPNAQAVTKELVGGEPKPIWNRYVEPDHPMFSVFRLINGFAADRGIQILYYSVQLNEEAQRSRGSDIRIRENYATIARAIGMDPGVHFLDLAVENPPSLFHDELDHLTPEGLQWVATRLVEKVLALYDAGVLDRKS